MSRGRGAGSGGRASAGDGQWLLYANERRETSPALPFTFASFSAFTRGLYNSPGNLYRIPLDAVLDPARR